MASRLAKSRRRLLLAAYALDRSWRERNGIRSFVGDSNTLRMLAAGRRIRINCPARSFTAVAVACESKSNDSDLLDTSLAVAAGKKPVRNPVAALRTSSQRLTIVTLVRPNLEILKRPLREVAFCLNSDGNAVFGSSSALCTRR